MTVGIPTPAWMEWPIASAENDGVPPRPRNPVAPDDRGAALRANREGPGPLCGRTGFTARQPIGQRSQGQYA